MELKKSNIEIQISNLSHKFSNYLFYNINLTLYANTIYCIIGPSGTGKSTFLNLLAKYTLPTSGTIKYKKVNKIAWVFQNPFGVKNRNCIDHIVLPLLSKGYSRSEAQIVANNLLQKFNLENIKYKEYKTISGGEAQRLMLAKNILINPDLLLIDEPTAGLDRISSRKVIDTVKNLKNKNIIIVIATHDAEIMKKADKIINLEEFI
jgi:putative ABC transport system ATP-binding protein